MDLCISMGAPRFAIPHVLMLQTQHRLDRHIC